MRISPVSIRLSRHLTRLPFALAVLLLAAGCHSSKVAYQFTPAASPAATATAVTTGPRAALTPAPETMVAPATAQPVSANPTHTEARPPRQLRKLRRVVAQVLAQQHVPAVASRGGAAQSTRHVARPQQPAEVGLGTTVLGVLGLVVLPISLIGLLIWGGPIWAVLAGLAALAVLVAYLDPFG